MQMDWTTSYNNISYSSLQCGCINVYVYRIEKKNEKRTYEKKKKNYIEIKKKQ